MAARALGRAAGAVGEGLANVGRAAARVADGIAEGADALMDQLEDLAGLVHGTFNTVHLMTQSKALDAQQVACAKHVVYITAPDMIEHSLEHMTARADFAEAAMIAVACLICNIVMAAGIGIAALIFCFSDARANFEAKSFLLLAGISFACVGVSAAGIINPSWGAEGHGQLVKLIFEQREAIHAFRGSP